MKRILLALALLTSCFSTSFAGTITGTLQTSNGIPIKNGTIGFTLTQAGLIIGTGAIVPLQASCYTSYDGTVVGLPNPLAAPSVAVNSGSGTLPGGNYYVTFAFYVGGTLTVTSPEAVVNASSGGSLIISPPATFPANATGMNVYIGSTSGSETLQGTTTSPTMTFTQSVPLVAGASPSTTNTTVCSIAFNDTIIPYVGYNVSLISSSGKAYPGYPQSWQLNGGPSGTVNISQGAPLWNGTVVYPMPILAQPLNHGPQSIAGLLNMTGYNLVNVGNLGAGGNTLPAWAVDATGKINASQGYLVGGAPGASGTCLGSDGGAYDTPIHCLTSASLFYQFVQLNTSGQTQEPALNFTSRFSITDTAGIRSNVDLANSGVTPGNYTSANISVDIFGRVINASNGGGGGGTPVVKSASITGCTTGASSYDVCNVSISWPTAFADAGYGISCTAIDANVIGGGSSDALTVTVLSKTAAGASIAVQTQRSNIASPTEVDCVGIHN